MSDLRQQALISWLQKLYPKQKIEIESASSDASFRRYYRTLVAGKSRIVMDAPPEKENSHPFIHIDLRLHDCGINVPQIYQQDLKQGFLLIEDLGSTHYLDLLNKENANLLYADAMDTLRVIQTCVPHDDLPLYDAAKLKEEMDLFLDWFVEKHCQTTLNQQQRQIIARTWQLLIDSAMEQPQCFVHRDYHSRNLMRVDQHNPGIIDFQDAVYGPVTYDLVSLLKDCYIQWPREQVLLWADNHREQLLFSGIPLEDEDQFIKWFDLMGLQRHIKVLGIFCRLNYRDNKAGYLKDLPLTWHYVKEVCALYDELSPFADLLATLKLEKHI